MKFLGALSVAFSVMAAPRELTSFLCRGGSCCMILGFSAVIAPKKLTFLSTWTRASLHTLVILTAWCSVESGTVGGIFVLAAQPRPQTFVLGVVG